MATEDIDIDVMSDADLEAALAALGDEVQETETAEEPAQDVKTEGEVGQEPETSAPEKEAEPKKEDRQVPLSELLKERDKRQQEAQARAELQAQLEAYQQAQQTQQIDPLDPEFAQYTQAQLESMRGEFSQQMQAMRVEMSRELARQAIPDYEDTLRGLVEMSQDPLIGPLVMAANEQLANHPNPAMAAYQLAKRLAGGSQQPVDVESIKKQAVAEALAKLKEPAIKGHKTIARGSSLAPDHQDKKDPRDMSDAELEAQLRDHG